MPLNFPSPGPLLLGGFFNGLLLQTHLLQKRLEGFPLDDLGKGPLVVADNADAVDDYVLYDPFTLGQSQRVVDGNLLIYPDDGGLNEGLILMELFLLVEDFFLFEEVQNQFGIGILKKVLKKSFEFCSFGSIQLIPVLAQSVPGHGVELKILGDDLLYACPSLIPEFRPLELGIGLEGHYFFQHASNPCRRHLRPARRNLDS